MAFHLNYLDNSHEMPSLTFSKKVIKKIECLSTTILFSTLTCFGLWFFSMSTFVAPSLSMAWLFSQYLSELIQTKNVIENFLDKLEKCF